jgi:hypothetical protein
MTYTRTPDAIRDISLSGEYSAQWVKRGTEWLIRSELFVATACTGRACNWPACTPSTSDLVIEMHRRLGEIR